MKKIRPIHLLLLCVFSFFLLSACSGAPAGNAETVEMTEVDFDGGSSPDGEVVLKDADFEQAQSPASTFGEQNTETSVQSLGDGTKVEIVYDGYGNKIETRYFNNHPTVKMLVLSTSASGARREALVYGQKGERKKLPEEISEQAMSMPGSEIARAAGITGTYRDTPQGVPGSVSPVQPNQPYPPFPMPVTAQPNENVAPPPDAPVENKAAEPPTRPAGQNESALNSHAEQNRTILQRQVNQASFKRRSKTTNDADKTLD